MISSGDVPALSAQQMREVDRIRVEELRIELIQMMENAGRNLADLAIRRFSPMRVVVLAGGGGNGGGGLVAARHLANRGVEVSVVLSKDRAAMTPVPFHQLDILDRMGVSVSEEPSTADVVIDALIGYSLRGAPSGRTAQLIRWANQGQGSVLALDTPSGLDVDDGNERNPCIGATATMTLAMPKIGLFKSRAVGELYVADISVPSDVYSRLGLRPPQLFEREAVVRLRVVDDEPPPNAGRAIDGSR